MKTLGAQLAARESGEPEKRFLIGDDQVLTYAEAGAAANRLARHMMERGVQPGDLIAVMLPRSPAAVLVYLAAARCGAIPYPLSHLAPPERLAAVVRDYPARIICIHHAHEEKVGGYLQACAPDMARIVSGEGGTDTLQRLFATGSCAPPSVTVTEDQVCYLNFTSGSTGRPKAARATHANLYWNTRAAVEVFSITSEDIHLPLFAVHSHPHEMFCRALYTGGATVLH
ncbi:acyl--CoA ligase, partial [bacterium]|nr:acyl--CoA ligase [candidate division CSSED10-310 bacterium]